MSFRKLLTLSSGAVIPQIGLGTWLSKPHEVEKAVGTFHPHFQSLLKRFEGRNSRKEWI